MKSMTPLKTLREVNGETPHMQELAEFANAAYGRVETEPAPPDRTGGVPMPVKDAVFSNGGGYGSLVSAGRGDDVPFPEDVARVGGVRSSVDPRAREFTPVTPNEPDGWEDRGSGVNNIIRGGR
jgi:hypothetical protein